jgi:hypothetical protein
MRLPIETGIAKFATTGPAEPNLDYETRAPKLHESDSALETRSEGLRNTPTSRLHQSALTGRRVRSARPPEGLIGSIRKIHQRLSTSTDHISHDHDRFVVPERAPELAS